MPKTHRELVRRQIAHAHNNLELALKLILIEMDWLDGRYEHELDLALSHLALAEQEFSAQHPELGESLQLAIVMVIECKDKRTDIQPDDNNPVVQGLFLADDILEKFVKQVWGREDVNWESWRNEPDRNK